MSSVMQMFHQKDVHVLKFITCINVNFYSDLSKPFSRKICVCIGFLCGNNLERLFFKSLVCSNVSKLCNVNKYLLLTNTEIRDADADEMAMVVLIYCDIARTSAWSAPDCKHIRPNQRKNWTTHYLWVS